MEPTKEGLKHCAKGDNCAHPMGPDLPYSQFARNANREDGLQAYCRACKRQMYRESKSLRDHPDGYDGAKRGRPNAAPDDDPPDGSIIPATLRRLNGDGQAPAPSSNGAHPWGPIREVADAPAHGRVETKWWDELYDELLLRLERTPREKALEVPFPNKKMASCATRALRTRMYRKGRPRVMSIGQRGPKIYVSRGPQWSK